MFSSPSFILRSTNYKESDKILSLFTMEEGKINAIAKGARSSRKRFGGALVPYALFDATFSTSNKRVNNELYVITETTLINDHKGLSKNMTVIGAASYLLELVREITTPNERQSVVFDILKTGFQLLESINTASVRPMILTSCLRILASCGLAVSTGACTGCAKQVPDNKPVFFNPARGGIVCSSCGGGPILLDKQTASTLIRLSNSTLQESIKLKIDSETCIQLENAIQKFIQQHIEKDLKSTSYQLMTSQ